MHSQVRVINMLVKILIPLLDFTEKRKTPLNRNSWEDDDDEDEDDDDDDDDDDDGNIDDDEEYKNFYRKNVMNVLM